MAPHLSHKEFFTDLTTLLAKTQQTGHGSVYLTQKRLSHETPTSPTPNSTSSSPFPDLSPASPLPLIVRATDGKSQSRDRKKNANKVKLSTIVAPEDLEAFFARYAEVCKAGMQSLKKRDRSKRKKDKGKKKKVGGGGEGAK